MTPVTRIMRRTHHAPGGCLIFTGAKDHGGHGRVTVGSRRDGTYRSDYAHRVVWAAHHGTIPAGMVIKHRCDVAACVEVSHLELGTQSENSREMWERGRARLSNPSIITPDLIARVKAHTDEGLSLRATARALGIAPTTARRATRRAVA